MKKSANPLETPLIDIGTSSAEPTTGSTGTDFMQQLFGATAMPLLASRLFKPARPGTDVNFWETDPFGQATGRIDMNTFVNSHKLRNPMNQQLKTAAALALVKHANKFKSFMKSLGTKLVHNPKDPTKNPEHIRNTLKNVMLPGRMLNYSDRFKSLSAPARAVNSTALTSGVYGAPEIISHFVRGGVEDEATRMFNQDYWSKEYPGDKGEMKWGDLSDEQRAVIEQRLAGQLGERGAKNVMQERDDAWSDARWGAAGPAIFPPLGKSLGGGYSRLGELGLKMAPQVGKMVWKGTVDSAQEALGKTDAKAAPPVTPSLTGTSEASDFLQGAPTAKPAPVAPAAAPAPTPTAQPQPPVSKAKTFRQ